MNLQKTRVSIYKKQMDFDEKICIKFTSRCSGGYSSPENSSFCGQVNFNSRVAPGVVDLASKNFLDRHIEYWFNQRFSWNFRLNFWSKPAKWLSAKDFGHKLIFKWTWAELSLLKLPKTTKISFKNRHKKLFYIV